MRKKPDIVDEVFIPEGLEFREEYLEQAMKLYAIERRKLWLRKVWIGSAAAVVTGLAILVYISSSHTDFIQPVADHSSGNTQQDMMPQSPEMKEGQSDLKDASSQAQSAGGPERASNDKGNTGSSDKNTGVYPKASDTGGSLSSGFESPVPGPLFSSETKRRKNRQTPSAPAGSEMNVSLIDQVETNKDLVLSEEKSRAEKDAGAAVSEFLSSEETAENASRVLIPEKIAGRDGLLPRLSLDLQTNQRIPMVFERNWSLYLVAGIIPIADYGSSRVLRPDVYGGLGMRANIRSGWSIDGTMDYYQISETSHPHSVSSTSYDLDYTTNTVKYITDRLQYGGLHLALSKKIYGAHRVGLGYAASYLITGRNSIENYTESYDNAGEASSEKSFGYVKGFRDFNQQLVLTYEYAAGRNKFLGVQARYGLTDITKNGYFDTAGIHRNSFVMAYFKMNLIQ